MTIIRVNGLSVSPLNEVLSLLNSCFFLAITSAGSTWARLYCYPTPILIHLYPDSHDWQPDNLETRCPLLTFSLGFTDISREQLGTTQHNITTFSTSENVKRESTCTLTVHDDVITWCIIQVAEVDSWGVMESEACCGNEIIIILTFRFTSRIGIAPEIMRADTFIRSRRISAGSWWSTGFLTGWTLVNVYIIMMAIGSNDRVIIISLWFGFQEHQQESVR